MELKKWLKTAAILGLSGAVLAACGNSNEGGSEAGDEEVVLNWTETQEIPTMDTTMVTDTVGFTVMNNVNEGLYRQGPDGEYELGMAAEEPTISEDGLTYTYKIREDAVWSNGEPVTANDFVYAWQRLVNPDQAAPYSYLIDGIVANASEIMRGEMEPSELGVSAVDDKTFEVSLVREIPYLKGLLTMAPLYPLNQAFVEEQGDSYATNSDTVLYNGPFTLDGWDGTNLTWAYQKNDQYWDADTVQVDTVNWQVLKETSTALNLFDSGAIDYTSVTGEYIANRVGDPNLQSQSESSVFYLKMNQERNGEATPLANENIRKGISQAFDKQAFVDGVLQDGSVPADYLVPTGLATDPETDEDFRDQNGALLSYDLEQAQADFALGLEELGEESITLEILADDSEGGKRDAEYLQGQLTTNLEGLNVEIVTVPFKNRIQADSNQDYDLQMSGWGADYADPINYLELFITDGGNNNSGYSNPEYDALIEASTQTEDEKERWDMLLEAEKILLDDAAIAPIYQRSKAYLENPAAEGVVRHLVGAESSFKWATRAAE